MRLSGCSNPDDPACCLIDANGLIDCKICDGTGRWSASVTCEWCGGSGRMPWPWPITFEAQMRLIGRSIEAALR